MILKGQAFSSMRIVRAWAGPTGPEGFHVKTLPEGSILPLENPWGRCYGPPPPGLGDPPLTRRSLPNSTLTGP